MQLPASRYAAVFALRAAPVAAVAATLVALPFAPLALAETVAEAMTRAVAVNPEIRAAAANRAATGEAVNQARGAYFPTIDATVGRGRETSNNASTRPLGDQTLNRSEAEVTLSQLLFDTGATSSQVRRFEARSEGASHQFASQSETIGFRAAQAYLEVMRLRALVDLAAESVDAHRRTLKLVTLLSVGGAGRQSDVQQVVARLAQAESSLFAQQGQYDQAVAGYRHLTGRMPEELTRPDSAAQKLPAELDQAIAQALAAHPAVLAAQKEVEAAQAEREFSRARLGPRINLELGVSQNHDLDGVRGLSAERIAMLRLRYNLFRGGSDEARIREAQLRIDEAAAGLEKARIDVERDVRQAWQNLKAERMRLPQLALYASTSAEVLEAYRAQFKLGLRSLLDVLNSENEQFAARGSHASGEYAVLAGEYRLLAGMGRLLAAMGIALPAEGAPAQKAQ